MFRLAVAGACIALLAAGIYLFSGSDLPGHLPAIALVLAAAALVLSLAAAVLSVRAMRSFVGLRNDIVVLARSVDQALADLSARTDKGAVTISQMASSVAGEVERLSERIAAQSAAVASAPEPGPDNVVPHPSAWRKRTAAPPEADAAPPPGDTALETAFHKAVSAGQFDMLLQPIVSVGLGAAAGFEAFAGIPLDAGRYAELRRPAAAAAVPDMARFERLLIASALQTGRKRLGSAGAAMPLHVAVSDALLGDGQELAAALELLETHPDLCRSLVLSMPVALATAGQHVQALDLLAERGVRFAAEGWDDALGRSARSGLAFLKMTADRLLDRERSFGRPAPGATIVEQAEAGRLTVVATDVASDDDAVALIDLGIDLMSGSRFGGPKRLKPDGAGKPGRLALI